MNARPKNLADIAQKLRDGIALSEADTIAVTSLVERERQRDQTAFAQQRRLIGEIRNRYFPAHTAHAAAQEIAARWGRYAGNGGWRRDRREDACPGYRRGIERELWELQRLRPHPLSADRIRKIVGQFEMPNASADDLNSLGNEGR